MLETFCLQTLRSPRDRLELMGPTTHVCTECSDPAGIQPFCASREPNLTSQDRNSDPALETLAARGAETGAERQREIAREHEHLASVVKGLSSAFAG